VNAHLIVVFCQIESEHGRRKLRCRVGRRAVLGGHLCAVERVGVVALAKGAHDLVDYGTRSAGAVR